MNVIKSFGLLAFSLYDLLEDGFSDEDVEHTLFVFSYLLQRYV